MTNRLGYRVLGHFAPPRYFKQIVFKMLLFLYSGMACDASGQTTSFCGYYQAVPPNGTNPDSLVYDRFGNVFDLEDLMLASSANVSSVPDCSTGYFNVTWVGSPPQEAQMVVCEVLSYVSSVVQQRQGQNNCGTIPAQSVDIQIFWVNFSNPDPNIANQIGLSGPLPASGAGIASPFYSDPLYYLCNEVTLDRPFIKINGGKAQGPDLFDARLILNSAIAWNYYPTKIIFPEMDLYTVVLHETMHCLGFASRMGFSDAYSLWDQTLRIVDNYIPGGGGANPQNVLLSTTNCKGNCWEAVSGLGIIAVNSCMGTSPDVVVGDAASAPIAGDISVNPNPINDSEINRFNNMLSHLSLDCNGQIESYIMRPGFDFGEFQRTITVAEQQILCDLGYSVSPINCEGCYVIAQGDIDKYEACCFKVYYVCGPGNTVTIFDQDLLCNDFSNSTGLAITEMKDAASNGVVTTTRNLDNTGWDVFIPSSVKGTIAKMLYTVTGCGCRQHTAYVNISIEQTCPPCIFPPDPCDNLLCLFNFEEYENPNISSQVYFGWPIIFSGNDYVGTPDVYQGIDGNHYIHMGNFVNAREALNIELKNCIKSGCELILNMDISHVSNEPAYLEIWGSKERPCDATKTIVVPIGNNCNITTACSSGNIFDPICIFEDLEGGYGSVFEPNFVNIDRIWKNETNQDVCYLTLVPSGGDYNDSRVQIDNTIALSRCKPEIACSNITTISEICEGEISDISFDVCASNLYGDVGNTTITPTVTLPPGWTLVGNDPEPFNLTEGQCADVNLQVQMPAGTLAGTIVNFVLSGTATGVCTEVDWSCEVEVEVVHCSEFACPCTGLNDLNIDAGDVSANPNGPNITPVSILATAIPANTFSLSGVPTLMKPCIAIRGNLLIDNNYDLLILGGEIRMQPGSKIIVAPGSTLRLGLINQGTGTERGIHGCEQMWRSIEVQPGGNLYAAYNVIQDAEYAFDLRGTYAAPATFGSYDNDYDRNHVGIRVKNAGFAALNQPYPAVLNRFRASSPLLPNFSNDIFNWNATAPYSGLSLANTTFFLGSPSAPTLFNEFNGLRNGIVAEACALDVLHTRFLNAKGTLDYLWLTPPIATSEGMGIFARSCAPFNVRNCTFDGAVRAIHAPQSSPDIRNSLIQNVDGAVFCLPGPYNRINIFDNDIYCRGLGLVVEFGGAYTRVNINQNDPIQIVPSALFSPTAIRLKNMPEASAQIKRVTGNNIVLQAGAAKGIDMKNTGGWWIHGNDIQYANPNSDFEGGINLSKADNNKIQENTITANGNASDNGKVGIFVEGSEHNKICCNTTENLFTGFQFLGVSDDTKLRYSDIGNHVFGLLCGNPAALGLTAIIGDQLQAGNTWNGLYDATGAGHYGGQQNVEGSEFFVELPQALPLWPDNPLSPAKPGEWFRDLPGSTATCVLDPSNCPPLPLLAEEDPDGPGGSTGIGRLLTGNELAIGRGEYGGTGAYSLATQFEGERSLYAKIKRDSSLLGQDSLVDQFFVHASTGVLGAMYEMDRQMVALGNIGEEDWDLLLELERGADSLIGLIHQTDSAYQIAPTAADSLALQNQKMNLLALLNTGQATWQDLIGDLKASWLINATAIIGQNATIPDTNMLVANRKALNRIWLETLASGNYNATQSQLDDLLDVALQCYYEGGDAVLQARALYGALAQPLELDDALICTGGGEERSQIKTEKVTDFKVKVVPNPAKDQFSVQASGVPEGAWLHVQIADLNGKILKDARVRNGEVLAYAFAPGLYFCRVLVGDVPAKVVKFIVVL